MRTRVFLTSLIAVGLLASPAMAGTGLHGRSPDTQAAMLAMTITTGAHQVQILNRFCDNPGRQMGCVPIKHRMQVAIEQAIDTPITWVTHRERHAGQFWVFAPVRFNDDPVRTKYAWRDPGRYGCYGWTRLDWRHAQGVWDPFRGVGVAGCSAVP